MNKNMTRVLCQSMITWDRAHPQYLPEINTPCPGPVFRLFGNHREPHCGYMLFRRHNEYQVSAEMHERMMKVRSYNKHWSI